MLSRGRITDLCYEFVGGYFLFRYADTINIIAVISKNLIVKEPISQHVNTKIKFPNAHVNSNCDKNNINCKNEKSL